MTFVVERYSAGREGSLIIMKVQIAEMEWGWVYERADIVLGTDLEWPPSVSGPPAEAPPQ